MNRITDVSCQPMSSTRNRTRFGLEELAAAECADASVVSSKKTSQRNVVGFIGYSLPFRWTIVCGAVGWFLIRFSSARIAAAILG